MGLKHKVDGELKGIGAANAGDPPGFHVCKCAGHAYARRRADAFTGLDFISGNRGARKEVGERGRFHGVACRDPVCARGNKSDVTRGYAGICAGLFHGVARAIAAGVESLGPFFRVKAACHPGQFRNNGRAARPCLRLNLKAENPGTVSRVRMTAISRRVYRRRAVSKGLL